MHAGKGGVKEEWGDDFPHSAFVAIRPVQEVGLLGWVFGINSNLTSPQSFIFDFILKLYIYMFVR